MTLLLFFVFAFTVPLLAQTDSLKTKQLKPPTHADSLYLAKLNSNGNLMIAGGVGLCAAGGYLIYNGVKVYQTRAAANSIDPSGDVYRNQKQGIIYMAAGGVAIAGGIVLTAFGARNKVDFKLHKKMMTLQSGILDSGALGLALNF
jgi:hypothetical protein